MSFSPQNAYSQSGGITFLGQIIQESRDPSSLDINYPLNQLWKNTTSDEFFILVSFSSSTGTVLATWESQATVGETFTPDSGGAVGPDASGNINLLGTSGFLTTTGSPSTNTITFDVGSLVASKFNADTGSAIASSNTITLAGTANQIATNGSGSTITYSLIGPYTPSTYTNHSLLLGQGTSSITSLGAATNGQIPIGSTGANPVLSTLTAGTYTVITNGAGSITVSPMSTAKWIVNPVAGAGTHTTIASAITSASSGDTIFITPGTYTENLTHKAGVDLTGFSCNGDDSTVNIVGKMTFTTAGTVTLSGLSFTTNSDYILEVTGSAASIVIFDTCTLNLTNHSGIHFTSSSSSSQISIANCFILNTTDTNVWTHSGAGILILYTTNCNGTPPTTPNTISGSGAVDIYWSSLNTPTTLSGTSSFFAKYSYMQPGIDANALLIGSGCSANIHHSDYGGQIVANGTATIYQSSVGSAQTNVITGGGTLNAGIITFTGSSAGVNTTTVNKLTTYGGTIV